jgi:hypothetical protein
MPESGFTKIEISLKSKLRDQTFCSDGCNVTRALAQERNPWHCCLPHKQALFERPQQSAQCRCEDPDFMLQHHREATSR